MMSTGVYPKKKMQLLSAFNLENKGWLLLTDPEKPAKESVREWMSLDCIGCLPMSVDPGSPCQTLRIQEGKPEPQNQASWFTARGPISSSSQRQLRPQNKDSWPLSLLSVYDMVFTFTCFVWVLVEKAQWPLVGNVSRYHPQITFPLPTDMQST